MPIKYSAEKINGTCLAFNCSGDEETLKECKKVEKTGSRNKRIIIQTDTTLMSGFNIRDSTIVGISHLNTDGIGILIKQSSIYTFRWK